MKNDARCTPATSPLPIPANAEPERMISIQTILVALEAIKMVYRGDNIVWLQEHGREKEYTRAMDELEDASEQTK